MLLKIITSLIRKFLFPVFAILYSQLFITQTLYAQIMKTMKTGDYYLEGVREVGSGFCFNPDHTFEFFFSYGAIDRMSTGNWAQKGDSLILNTPRKPATDFMLTTSRLQSKKQLTIRVKDENTMILGYIYCRIETTEGNVLEANSDQKGLITFDHVQVKTISLLHELWADRLSNFTVKQPGHNYFEFTIARWITDVEFADLSLHFNTQGLTGQHPLLQGDQFKYVSE
jgi:protease II